METLTMPRPFGKWLAEAIEREGTNPRQLALKIGKTPAHLSRVIAGDVGVSPDVLRALADALRLDRADVFRAWSEAESGAVIAAIEYAPHPDLAPLIESFNGLGDAALQEQLRSAWEADLAAAGRLVSRKKGIIGRGEQADAARYGQEQLAEDEKRVRFVTPEDLEDGPG